MVTIYNYYRDRGPSSIPGFMMMVFEGGEGGVTAGRVGERLARDSSRGYP